MKKLVGLLAVLVVAGGAYVLVAGEGADETKPLPDVKAEAEKLDASGLRTMAVKYKDAIAGKEKDIDALQAKLKDVPLTEIAGEAGQALKKDIEELTRSLTALTQRFQVYFDRLKEEGGDLSGLGT